MADLPIDIHQIWNELGDSKNWDKLKEVLSQHQNILGPVESSTIEMVKQKIDDFKNNNQAFPSSPEQLLSMISGEVTL